MLLLDFTRKRLSHLGELIFNHIDEVAIVDVEEHMVILSAVLCCFLCF